MSSLHFSRKFLAGNWAVAASYSLFTSLFILLARAAPGRPFYAGISIPGLVSIVLPFCAFVLAVRGLVRSLAANTPSNDLRGDAWVRPERLRRIQGWAALFLTASLLAVCLPAYHFGSLAGYYVRVQPLILWVGMVGLHLVVLTLIQRRVEIVGRLRRSWSENRAVLQRFTWIFLGFALLWIVIAITGIGISGSEDYWYEAGVPILPWQVVVTIGLGLGYGYLERRFFPSDSPGKDRRIFLAIWLIVALNWAVQPAPVSYFNPAARPPNGEMYPYSDAAGLDVQSQFMLMGQGIANGRSEDNPLYPIFLTFIHLLSGWDYQANMALQAAVFAVFPAAVYLIGRQLHGRSAGMMAAAFMAFRGGNAILGAQFLNLASPKQMLTDFPVSLGVALVILCILLWIKDSREPVRAVWIGAAIGFSFLIRPTALALAGALPFIFLFPGKAQINRMRILFLVLLGLLLVLTPWGIRNSLNGTNPLTTYLRKFDLVIDKRYPEARSGQDNPAPSSGDDGLPDQTQATDPTDDGRGHQAEGKWLIVASVASNHFVHNLIASALTLPDSAVFDDLHHTIKSPDAYWRPYWDGRLTLSQTAFLSASLGLVALGLAVLWKRQGTAGLIPVMAFLMYQLANAAGRTSGGRYIVPVDWIVAFYFAIGLSELLALFAGPRSTPEADSVSGAAPISSPKRVLAAGALILMLASLLPASELLFPTRYGRVTKGALLDSRSFRELEPLTEYSRADIAAFLDKRRTVVLTGRALFPRYFSHRGATPGPEDALSQVDFPRTEFTLAGPAGSQTVLLSGPMPAEFPHAADVYVLGCRQDGYVDALLVIFYDPLKRAYERQPGSSLECPLEQFVCAENGNCE
jgi:hypothetical protein